MASTLITEDYYMILEVEQTATPQLITKSYRRLALKLHPDRNPDHDTTQDFQLLGRAYETLKDEIKRRAYDLIYPSITRGPPSPQTTETPRPRPASTPQSGALSDEVQFSALQKSKQERGARWWTKKNAFESSIFEQLRDIRRLEQEIKNLDSILAAMAAEEAQKNSWGTWLLSPILKKREESQEDKDCKERERQERRIEKDMKERRLELKKADLKTEESLFRKEKDIIEAADLLDNKKIRVIQDRKLAREKREMQERERVERERRAKIWKQQQEQQEIHEREAAEALRKQQAEERAAEQKRQDEQARVWQKIIDDNARRLREQYTHHNHPDRFFTAEGSYYQASTSTCRHEGWWPKIQGRAACPECYESWTYLLQCPGCKMKACPRCQSTIRPRMPHRRAQPRVRTPSPDYSFYDY